MQSIINWINPSIERYDALHNSNLSQVITGRDIVQIVSFTSYQTSATEVAGLLSDAHHTLPFRVPSTAVEIIEGREREPLSARLRCVIALKRYLFEIGESGKLGIVVEDWEYLSGSRDEPVYRERLPHPIKGSDWGVRSILEKWAREKDNQPATPTTDPSCHPLSTPLLPNSSQPPPGQPIPNPPTTASTGSVVTPARKPVQPWSDLDLSPASYLARPSLVVQSLLKGESAGGNKSSEGKSNEDPGWAFREAEPEVHRGLVNGIGLFGIEVEGAMEDAEDEDEDDEDGEVGDKDIEEKPENGRLGRQASNFQNSSPPSSSALSPSPPSTAIAVPPPAETNTDITTRRQGRTEIETLTQSTQPSSPLTHSQGDGESAMEQPSSPMSWQATPMKARKEDDGVVEDKEDEDNSETEQGVTSQEGFDIHQVPNGEDADDDDGEAEDEGMPIRKQPVPTARKRRFDKIVVVPETERGRELKSADIPSSSDDDEDDEEGPSEAKEQQEKGVDIQERDEDGDVDMDSCHVHEHLDQEQQQQDQEDDDEDEIPGSHEADSGPSLIQVLGSREEQEEDAQKKLVATQATRGTLIVSSMELPMDQEKDDKGVKREMVKREPESRDMITPGYSGVGKRSATEDDGVSGGGKRMKVEVEVEIERKGTEKARSRSKDKEERRRRLEMEEKEAEERAKRVREELRRLEEEEGAESATEEEAGEDVKMQEADGEQGGQAEQPGSTKQQTARKPTSEPRELASQTRMDIDEQTVEASLRGLPEPMQVFAEESLEDSGRGTELPEVEFKAERRRSSGGARKNSSMTGLKMQRKIDSTAVHPESSVVRPTDREPELVRRKPSTKSQSTTAAVIRKEPVALSSRPKPTSGKQDKRPSYKTKISFDLDNDDDGLSEQEMLGMLREAKKALREATGR